MFILLDLGSTGKSIEEKKTNLLSYYRLVTAEVFSLSNLIYINDAGQGGRPVWNETLTFKVEYPGQDGNYKLILKIMDKDTFSADDSVGEAT